MAKYITQDQANRFKQGEDNMCGPCCAGLIVELMSKKPSSKEKIVEFLKAGGGWNDVGCTPIALCKALNAALRGAGVSSVAQLLSSAKGADVASGVDSEHPGIARLKVSGGHFVAVLATSAAGVTIFQPYGGTEKAYAMSVFEGMMYGELITTK